MKNKYGIIALSLIVLQLLIVFSSWLITAAFPYVNINSLLSGSGLRWFAGQFTNNLKSNMLVWLLLLSIDWGVYKTSGLHDIVYKLIFRHNRFSELHYRERVGIRFALFCFFCFIALSIVFTILPEAPLLSVTGSLFPSSFFVRTYSCFVFHYCCFVSIVWNGVWQTKDAFRNIQFAF